jgi:hypothetical protein
LIQQITNDSEFLKKKDIRDYSLILRVTTVGQCDSVALENVCPIKTDALYKTYYPEQNGFHATVDEQSRTMHVYEFGLIDVLQPWNFAKKVADSFKNWHCGDGEIRDTVNANAYQQRFVDFFSSRIVGDVRTLDLAECETKQGGGRCTLIDLQAASSGGNVGDSLRSFGLWLVVLAVVAWLVTIWICRRLTATMQKRVAEMPQATFTPQEATATGTDSVCRQNSGLALSQQFSQLMSYAPSWGVGSLPSWGAQNAQWNAQQRV